MERLKQEQANAESNKQKITSLNEILADYIKKLEMATNKVESLSEPTQKRMETIQEGIAAEYKNLDALEKRKNEIENMVGLSGNTLLACLVNIHNYSKQIKDGATAYSPLVSILEGKFTTSSVNCVVSELIILFALF